MSTPGSVIPLLLGSTATAYNVERSLRFNSSDSAYLSRALTASNRKKWSFSFWFKKTTNSQTDHYILDSSAWTTLTFNNNALGLYDAGAGAYLRLSAQVFRDPSAWYYILVVYDSDNATAQNRLRFYCNGVEITTWQTNTTITSGYETRINGAYTHTIGTALGYPAGTINGYLADIHFIDGQALDPTSFGEFSATTGVWVPKAYTGSYGTNGFRLDFSDNSAATATTLGKDRAGSNNWTPNNLSVTAGAGNDSLVDVPTNGAQTDTGAGGEVRGNYATLNPLSAQANVILANGNLDWSTTQSSSLIAQSTIAMSSGKWYCEFTATSVANMFGLQRAAGAVATTFVGGNADSWGYYADNGNKYTNGGNSSYGASFTSGDVIGVAFDADAGTLTFYKNGASQGQAYSGLTNGPYTFALGNGGNRSAIANFGQRSFAYTAPSGFKALCTANLPAPVVTKPSTVMDVALYTGNASARSITGIGFSPDFVWIKGRSGATDHALYDIVRGAQKDLVSNNGAAETTQTTGLTAFNSDGFSIGTLAKLNTSSATYAGWCWDAGSSNATNNSGTITSTVRANASAGFSVVTWSCLAVAGTVGHGLGVAPSFIVFKDRNATASWFTYHKDIGTGKYLQLNSTAATVTNSIVYSTAPTSTVFDPGTAFVTGSGYTAQVAYCFAPVVGYSSFGSYTGNGSTDGPFVYTGFRPRWVMIKNITDGYDGGSLAVSHSWAIMDSARYGYNVVMPYLGANKSDAEVTSYLRLDLLSNGFKLRTGVNSDLNANGQTFIYAAFAESPFQYARAR